MIEHKFLIIGGTFKSGTSSLFTYLSQVNGITPSNKKETGFFVPARYDKPVPAFSEYLKYFDKNKGLFLEASPGYLYGEEKIANAIKDYLDDNVWLVFLLRNPVDRYISFYKMLKNGYANSVGSNLVDSNTSLQEYYELCQNYSDKSAVNIKEDYILSGLKDGCYSDFLEIWYRIFDKDKIKVIFFDELIENSKHVCIDILKWVGNDDYKLEHIDFRIVNKSREHKNKFLRDIARRINMKYEGFFRKNDNIKKYFVKFYDVINTSKNSNIENDKIIEDISTYYDKPNRDLKEFLTNMGYYIFPDWLK